MENNGSLQVQEFQDTCPRFLTIAEVMERTTLYHPTICRHIKAGTIPVLKIGNRVIIDAKFLDQLRAWCTKEDKI